VDFYFHFFFWGEVLGIKKKNFWGGGGAGPPPPPPNDIPFVWVEKSIYVLFLLVKY